MSNYVIRAPKDAVHNGNLYSTDTANVDLSSVDWAPSADPSMNGGAGDTLRCPRAFIPKADGVLAIQAVNDAAVSNVYVLKGILYPIALKAIDQSACDAALRIADAVALLY